jgi:hypothetical protein
MVLARRHEPARRDTPHGQWLEIGPDGCEARADFQKFRLELLVLADIDWMHGVGRPKLFERDGSLAAVGRGPRIEINHGERVPVLYHTGRHDPRHRGNERQQRGSHPPCWTRLNPAGATVLSSTTTEASNALAS